MGEARVTDVGSSTSRPIPRTRAYGKTLMRLIRRVHLYAGLFMFPWILLYGVTAFLFNHPNSFPDHDIRTFAAAELSGTALDELPGPAQLAEQVVAILQARASADSSDRPAFRLVDPEQAAYSRDRLFASSRGGGQQHSIQYDLVRNTGIVRTRPEGVAGNTPFPVTRVRVDGLPHERFKASLPTILERMQLPHGEIVVQAIPELTFVMEADARLWRVTYNMQRGSMTGQPLDSPADLSARRFLTRMHLAHGFPASVGARWFWAVAVDAMFVAMVFWGFSGILMWWQLKTVRGSGALVLALSAVVATTLVFGMYQSLAP